MKSIVPVILCGGNGSRMWPLSRSQYPKQFIKLPGRMYSLLQDTITRIDGLFEQAILVCNQSQRFMLAAQLKELNYCPRVTILEACSRNTAASVALAALKASENNQDPVLLILPSDHIVGDKIGLVNTIYDAASFAIDGDIVHFGISPTKSETGYGYIKKGSKITDRVNQVEQFIEKPDKATAEHYCSHDGYVWNSGIFLCRASRIIEELDEYCPEILESCLISLGRAKQNLGIVELDFGDFSQCSDQSIDTAVMEKTVHGSVIELDVGWSDVGSWLSLSDMADKDQNNNTVQGDIILRDTQNSFIQSNSRLVAVVGLEDVVVIETPDAILVAAKDKVEDIKSITETLISDNRTEHETHRKVYRPWGNYDSIDSGERFQVKEITVNPGEKLSVQMHHHRSEHWIVVSGTAMVTKGDRTFLLTENQSTYIPQGETHSLENPGKIKLKLIEVQSGVYLGEDDIVRYTDRYGRI